MYFMLIVKENNFVVKEGYYHAFHRKVYTLGSVYLSWRDLYEWNSESVLKLWKYANMFEVVYHV